MTRTWSDGDLFSPISGLPLSAVGSMKPDSGMPGSGMPSSGLLVAGDEVWPVIDDIAFLRADRVELAQSAARLIEQGDIVAATALLLTDQDPFAPDPPPSVAQTAWLVNNEASLTFRSAMHGLRLGPVADYFAHRWTDPTFLSGLALLGHALPRDHAPVVLELACGAGHFLAALAHHAVPAIGADLVFAKLWLARHFVSPGARLVCFSAQAPWPLEPALGRTLFCHDAFYFLPDKSGIASQMRRHVGAGGTIAIGHAHNAATDNHSSGQPLTIDGYAALFPGALLFDDRELTRAYVEGRTAQPEAAAALGSAPALSLLWRQQPTRVDPAREVPRYRTGLLESEPAMGLLQLNPLYRLDPDAARIAWPTARYEQEYAALASYPPVWTGPIVPDPEDPSCAGLVRRRVYVELPPRW